MHFTPAPRPPRPAGGAQQQSRYKLDEGAPLAIGQVNYASYAHEVAKPGPVLSAKTGKQYIPKMEDLGKRKVTQPKKTINRQSSYTGGQQASSGQGLDMFI